MAITIAQARTKLRELIAQVNDDQVALEIATSRGTAYLVSENEYLSLQETVYLLRSPRNSQRLRESLAEKRG